MLALAGGFTAWMAPDVVKDLQIWADPVAVPQAHIGSGKCKTKLVLVTCEARLTYSVGGRRYATSVDFFFVDVHFGDYTANVVRSAGRPELATLDIGLDKIWNRILTLLVLLGLFLAGFGAFVKQAVQTARLKAIVRSTDQLTPVAVTVTQITKSWLNKTAVCVYDDAHHKSRFSERLRKSEDPFFLGGKTALAVLPAGSSTPILLDEALSRVDLTDGERRTLHAARAGYAQGGPPQAAPAR
ncbi:MAG: hypothetical protein KIT36_17015 [Alphaproteobacteria bacterium]|nr:hypothetical protein [Alphaproteobacteria bacterium]